MPPNFLTTRAISHRERVCSLYKQALRTVESYVVMRPEYRYRAVLMRQRFELYKDEKDMRKARKLLEEGEEELFQNQHPIPFRFQYSPGGSAYNREAIKPDWIVDTWHPLEKAQFPKYFAQREKRKDEWIKYWEKNYNRGRPYDEHEHEWHGNWDEKTATQMPPPDHKKGNH